METTKAELYLERLKRFVTADCNYRPDQAPLRIFSDETAFVKAAEYDELTDAPTGFLIHS